MSKSFDMTEVARHNNEKDGVWVVVEGGVYDVSGFLEDHPGGRKILINNSGKDATDAFWKFHSRSILEKSGGPLKIGQIGGGDEVPVGGGGESQAGAAAEEAEDPDTSYFGDLVPFGDPLWYQDWESPFYNDTHRRLRTAIRKYTDEKITPFCHEWDENKEIPVEAYRDIAQAGWLACVVGPHYPEKWAKAGGLPLPAGVTPDQYDAFHSFIVGDELSRSGSAGVMWGLLGGLGIGLPPIMRFGSPEMQDRVIPACLNGSKRICLAITEPSGGSDVANLETTAEKTPDGKHYIVNGEKKWITNGIYCDYFTVAVRTGGKGMGGISLMLIEKTFPGVKCRQMKCSGAWASGTTYITFEDVKVPVENIIGQENKGFQLIMSNFNGERMGIAIQATRFARVCLEESIKYASKRKTFGILLRDHAVIQLAHMARMVEATHAWIEIMIFQTTRFSEDDLMLRGGGGIALLKAQSTQTFEYCAREAAQIFGGLSYSRGGQGEKVERLYREVRAYAIPGGSEEIMLDLGMRQSIKVAEIMGAKL